VRNGLPAQKSQYYTETLLH